MEFGFLVFPLSHIDGFWMLEFGIWMLDIRCDLPDGVAGAQTDPLGDGTVLALSLSKLLLGAEGLVALLKK